jgi:hypothetical protein
MNIENNRPKTISEAVRYIITREQMRTSEDLDRWCGGKTRNKIYTDVQYLVPEHWNRIQSPKESVRACYEKMLSGYKIYKGVEL